MKQIYAEEATVPRSEVVKRVAWVYAAILVVMAVGQLFSFEKFIPIIGDYMLAGGERTATLLAALIVVSEVFALPFLLQMRLSYAMRWFSLGLSLLAAATWLVLSIIALMSDVSLTNSGILGAKVAIPIGWLHVAISLGLTVLAFIAAWGLLPNRKK